MLLRCLRYTAVISVNSLFAMMGFISLIETATFILLFSAAADGCGDIPVVPNAVPNDTNINPPFASGVGISYKCMDEFKPTGGSSTAVCNGDTWEVPTLKCDPVGCGGLPSVNHAVPRLDQPKESYDVGTQVRYQCDVGYASQQGTDIAVCSLKNRKSQWDVPSLTCHAVSCGPPEDAPFANKIGNLYTFPNDVAYVCYEGYTMMSDRPNTTCLPNGRWSVGPPTCQIVSCPKPPSLSNGEANFRTVTYGSTVKYSCKESYKLHGAKEIQCLSNGKWSDNAPECKVVECRPYFDLPGGRIVYGVNATGAGDLVIFQCNPPDSSRLTIKCDVSGEWSAAPPICQGAEAPTKEPTLPPKTTKPEEKGVTGVTGQNATLCGNPGIIDHGRLDGVVIFPTSSTIRYVCDEGYTIKGTDTFICLPTGLWDQTVLPKCHKRSWLEIIIGVVVGVIVVAVICAGAIIFYIRKRRGTRSDNPLNPGNRNKAKVLDAKNRDEVKFLGKDHKVIPVTSL